MTAINTVAHEVLAKDAAWPVLPIVMADVETGEIVYSSKFGAAIFGYTPEELLGRPVEVLVPHQLRHAHARWRQDAAVPKTRLMGLGRQIQGLRKDGTVFPVHIGLTSAKILHRTIGVAFVVDLTVVAGNAAMARQSQDKPHDQQPPAGFAPQNPPTENTPKEAHG